jgi:hypothetical protein
LDISAFDAALGTFITGSSQVRIVAYDGRCDIRIDTELTLAPGGVSECWHYGIVASGPELSSALSVYVLGKTGDHYWILGDLAGGAHCQSPNYTSANARFASSTYCMVNSNSSNPVCSHVKALTVSDGIIGTSNAAIDQTVTFDGRQYRRVLQIPIRNDCFMTATGNPTQDNVTVRAQTDGRIAVGKEVAPAGGELCPDFTDCVWTGGGQQRQGQNNCYNYAVNRRSDQTCPFTELGNCFSHPGDGAGLPRLEGPDVTVANVRERAIADGLILTTADGDCFGKCKVALVVAPFCDYHWLRQGSDGSWSHKVGWLPPSCRTASGDAIKDPERQVILNYQGGCDYTEFGGYFCVPDRATVGFHSDELGSAALAPLAHAPAGSDTVAILAPAKASRFPGESCKVTGTALADLQARIATLKVLAPEAAGTFTIPTGRVYAAFFRPSGTIMYVKEEHVAIVDPGGVQTTYVDTAGLLDWCNETCLPTTSVPWAPIPAASDVLTSVLATVLADRVRVEFFAPSSQRIVVRVVEVSGRVVRVLYESVGNGGRETVEWDGGDSSGGRAPSGVYIVTAQTARRSVAAKFHWVH